MNSLLGAFRTFGEAFQSGNSRAALAEKQEVPNSDNMWLNFGHSVRETLEKIPAPARQALAIVGLAFVIVSGLLLAKALLGAICVIVGTVGLLSAAACIFLSDDQRNAVFTAVEDFVTAYLWTGFSWPREFLHLPARAVVAVPSAVRKADSNHTQQTASSSSSENKNNSGIMQFTMDAMGNHLKNIAVRNGMLQPGQDPTVEVL